MEYLDADFETLPIEWRVRPLRDVAEIHDNKRAPINARDRESMKGIYPYCGANGVVDWINQYRFDGEYVLVAEDGGYWGKLEPSSYVMHGKFWVNNHAHVICERKGISNNRFLSCLLNFMNISPLIGGDARGKLTKSILERLPIVTPPLPEQRKIASVLSLVQRAIEQQERLIALTQELKRSLMHKLFTEGLRGERQKQTEIGPVPESWEVVKLDDVCEFMSGGTPSKRNNEFWVGSIPWVSPKDMKRPRLSDVTDHISEAALEDGSALAPAGSVFVVVRGMILAKDVPVAMAEVPMAFNQDMKAVVPGHRIIPLYLLYAMVAFKQNLFRKVGRSAHGTMTLLSSEVERFVIPLPDKRTQEEIADAISIVEKKNEQHQRKRDSLADLFRTLLHQLMTAQLRVHDLDLSFLEKDTLARSQGDA